MRPKLIQPAQLPNLIKLMARRTGKSYKEVEAWINMRNGLTRYEATALYTHLKAYYRLRQMG